AFMVEHHGFFRDGYESLAKVVTSLNKLDKRLVWARAGEICSRACLRRVADNDEIHVRFYGDRFWLQNDTGRRQDYVLFSRQTPGTPLAGVTVNGAAVGYDQTAAEIKLGLSLEAAKSAEVRLTRIVPEPAGKARRPAAHNAKVFVRRHLCEFRDNHL